MSLKFNSEFASSTVSINLDSVYCLFIVVHHIFYRKQKRSKNLCFLILELSSFDVRSYIFSWIQNTSLYCTCLESRFVRPCCGNWAKPIEVNCLLIGAKRKLAAALSDYMLPESRLQSMICPPTNCTCVLPCQGVSNS